MPGSFVEISDMKIKAATLINQLSADVRQLILTVNKLKSAQPDLLAIKPGPDRWSAIEVLDHLNSYGNYYLPELEKSLSASNSPATEWFRAGWFGDYFTRLMRPGADGVLKKKMSAPKAHRPAANLDSEQVIDTFIDQQYWLLQLLEAARQKPIGNIRTPISISKLIRLKAGDTFRFLIAHEQRHFMQIVNTVAEVQRVTGKSPGDHRVA